MATVKVNTVYPKLEDCRLDPVFKETFAYQLSSFLSKRFEKNVTDIVLNYFPERPKDNFEIAPSKEGVSISNTFTEYIKEISNKKLKKGFSK